MSTTYVKDTETKPNLGALAHACHPSTGGSGDKKIPGLAAPGSVRDPVLKSKMERLEKDHQCWFLL